MKSQSIKTVKTGHLAHNQKMILVLVFKGVNIGIRNFTGLCDIVSIVKRMG